MKPKFNYFKKFKIYEDFMAHPDIPREKLARHFELTVIELKENVSEQERKSKKAK